MKQLTYTIRKSNHCDYCTEHKNGYCKHDKCVYMKDKTITQQFEDIKEDICNHYCHYPYIWNEEKDGELSDSDICKNCPLNKL